MKIVVTFLVLILSTSVLSKELKNKDETKELSNSMAELFLKKNFQKAIDIAKPYWPLAEVELDDIVNQIESQWPIIDQRYGKAISSEYIKTEVIEDSFVQYYYLHKFQNHAIYWKISFYKPKDIWFMNNIIFLDGLDILYTEES